jgi:hypothetical protein
MEELYEMIFKRRSVRHYDPALKLTEAQLAAILAQTQNLAALDSGIKIAFEIVKREETSAKFGEYCLLFYSEKKQGYLINAGYMLEQMDLFMEKNGIGACWYGLAKPKENHRGELHHVIMLAFGRSEPETFRTDVAQFNRKDLSEIWQGDFDEEVSLAVRLAPSACNTQPWLIKSGAHGLTVYRNKKVRSFIPASLLSYFNTIDIGICLCMLEIALMNAGVAFERKMIPDAKAEDGLIEMAQYTLL